ncbi:MAG TPA: helix-turn-helix transcriptional regulator [Coriobacteriia bacterium]|nr:helix-turn-helix transcriptional regulator [Coriobacteriia bacterium]
MRFTVANVSRLDVAVGRRIQLAMERAGLNKVELAARLGTNDENVSRWTKGRSPISLAWVERIARALQVPIGELIPPEELPVSEYREAWAILESLPPGQRRAVIDTVAAIARQARAGSTGAASVERAG